MKLESLTHPDDDRELVQNACFYIGWRLRSPDSWEYLDIFTNQTDEVTIPKLIEAIQAKRDRLNPKVEPINKFAKVVPINKSAKTRRK